MSLKLLNRDVNTLIDEGSEESQDSLNLALGQNDSLFSENGVGLSLMHDIDLSQHGSEAIQKKRKSGQENSTDVANSPKKKQKKGKYILLIV